MAHPLRAARAPSRGQARRPGRAGASGLAGSVTRVRSSGFTLVEVLVALLILAGIAVMSWRGIDGMLRSREISQGSLERSERLQAVLVQWEQDLGALQDSEVVDPLSFDGASLRITRRQDTGLQLVSWSLRNGQLYRWASPVFTTRRALAEAYTSSQQGLATQGQLLPALDGLDGWQMFFYRGNAWSNAQSSGDVAAPAASAASGVETTETRVLPRGVRMVLQFAPGGQLAGSLTRQILLGPQS